ncbi:MAG TPA: PadR family transcriptional regulator [Glaciihabitans sp.]|jgi:DNA-binding PadR family transcriptional regulator|nr:PadR family transcriptional regulator [Glaciihabitans sp.]
MTPVFGHGRLRLYLLSLLAEEPRHGYELIQALGDRFGGTYVPSAGTIYPRLAKLEEEGLVTKTADGRKTVYAITQAGRDELAARESELNGIEDEVTDSVRRLADEVRSSVTSAMRTLRADLASAARDTARGTTRPAPTSTTTTTDAPAPAPSTASGLPGDTGDYPTTGSFPGEPAEPFTGPSVSREESRRQLQRAEMLLTEFRQDLRAGLRTRVATGSLSAHTVDTLEAQLKAARSAALGTGTSAS